MSITGDVDANKALQLSLQTNVIKNLPMLIGAGIPFCLIYIYKVLKNEQYAYCVATGLMGSHGYGTQYDSELLYNKEISSLDNSFLHNELPLPYF